MYYIHTYIEYEEDKVVSLSSFWSRGKSMGARKRPEFPSIEFPFDNPEPQFAPVRGPAILAQFSGLENEAREREFDRKTKGGYRLKKNLCIFFRPPVF